MRRVFVNVFFLCINILFFLIVVNFIVVYLRRVTFIFFSMRTFIFFLFFTVAGFFLLVSSCKKGHSSENVNEIVFDSIKVSNIYHLDGDSTKPSCSLKICYVTPVKYKDEAVLGKLSNELNSVFFDDESLRLLSPKDAIAKYTDAYINNYKEEAKSSFPDWQNSGESLDYFSFYKIIDSKVLFNKAQLISYQVAAMDYKGGANSYTDFKNIVLSLKDGSKISEGDIFKPGYENTLNQLIKGKIMKMNNAKSNNDLMELGFWGIEDLTSNNNFWVDDKGITYTFSQGEYAAPSLGEITVNILYKEIFDILKDDSPVSVFFE